ncbi:hypothetical protein [Bacillus sp. ISL-7]|uniref:hypothetical protein n=1 Tax=Bacillus sp. ISL-7 TaxID=2819136 RepID=UPI001BEA742F|nr:hypothetical protein [Bacillus sp. ISL-7]MBT2738120.1 hypothetical protein [Bacillus sp. ISL-7]
MDFIEVKLKKCTVYLLPEEIHHLLLVDIDLYKKALARGKGITRTKVQTSREEAKWESEGQIH